MSRLWSPWSRKTKYDDDDDADADSEGFFAVFGP